MNDGLASIDAIEAQRSQYQDGRVLSAAALAGDAEVNVAAWRRHQRTAHTPGIVAGLRVNVEDPKVTIEPGAAIDCYGRMLLIASARNPVIDLRRAWLVWLRYSVTLQPSPQSNVGRYKECPTIETEELTDLQRSLKRIESEGVLLAIIRGGKSEYCCCRYVGAVGNRIEAPSRRASVLLGPQSARDTRRFAIAVRSETTLEDVLTWDTTSTIRFSKPASIAAPPEKRGRPEAAPQPPIAVIGSPDVNLTDADILDPCRAREIIKSDILSADLPLEQFLSSCDLNRFDDPAICRRQLTTLLVRLLNCLLRSAHDEIFDASRPTVGTIIMDDDGEFCQITGIQAEKCSLSNHSELMPLADLQPRRWLSVWKAHKDDALSRLWPYWQALPGDYLCRLYLDSLLGTAIRPLQLQKQRGLFFKDSKPVELEPPASRIHLVEFKKDGQTHRQLRITIPDPGKENSPQRYRCSIGITQCQDPPAPLPGGKVFNCQTGWPRGILSVLADKSVDIHTELSVNSKTDSLLGLILKVKPDNPAAAGSTAPTNQPATIVKNAVDWEKRKVTRQKSARVQQPDSELIIEGELHNLTNLDIDSLQILVSIYGQSDTDHTPEHSLIVPSDPVKILGAASTRTIQELSPLTVGGVLKLPVPDQFEAETIIISLMVMGVNKNNEVILTEFTEVKPVPQ